MPMTSPQCPRQGPIASGSCIAAATSYQRALKLRSRSRRLGAGPLASGAALGAREQVLLLREQLPNVEDQVPLLRELLLALASRSSCFGSSSRTLKSRSRSFGRDRKSVV